MNKPKTKNYFIQQTKKGPKAAFVRTRPTPIINQGFLKRIVEKSVAPNFKLILQEGFTQEEKIAAEKIREMITKNSKISYDEVYSRVSSMFRAELNLKLGKRPINKNSVAQLFRKLIKTGAITVTNPNLKN